ncbi:nuclear transcription factor Y subunit A-2 [Gossypium hirsutum]|uniref:Nuclear transcription factor Y subunit n=1 Tax=Gossypium hirsutum TaxID=3635 RepID=A0ABM2ZXJ0_GOSHI|nr:nuclear transcription factor Y subunit A-2-like [Gossypium hirsutum]
MESETVPMTVIVTDNLQFSLYSVASPRTSPGDCKDSGDEPMLKAVIPRQQSLQSEHGLGQPMVCAKYPYLMDQGYGVFPTFGPQISGRVMLPLNLATEDGPIYVNAKQYNGIVGDTVQRLHLRLNWEIFGPSFYGDKLDMPYLHYSRHLHAVRRPRGNGGRFLNTKSSNTGKDGMEMMKANEGQLSRLTGSQISQVLQSNSGTINSYKEPNGGGSTFSGSEVSSSMYSRGDLSKWVAIADKYCCNLKI